jgi:hypothetical protein
MDERRSTVPGLPWGWGITSDDLSREYPCAGLLDGPARSIYRAVDVDANPDLTYRWLCQMRVAPYSYDLIDNRGRRSPQTLTPGADDLAVGQEMMVFRIASFEPGVHITGIMLPGPAKIFGAIAGTYLVVPRSDDTSRIVVRMDTPVGGLCNAVRAPLLAWGDLVMMRKQLLTFKALAERGQAALVAAAV